MAGYYEYSMSNNAVAAYENGEKPLSKWTKADILDEIRSECLVLNCSESKLKKLPVKALKDICLRRSSWHHTGNHFNKTDFYSLDIDRIESLTDEELDDIIVLNKDEKNKTAEPENRWECAFLEWSGTRKHPAAKELIEEGIVKGDWFFRQDGSKKKTSAKGFRFIRKIQ